MSFLDQHVFNLANFMQAWRELGLIIIFVAIAMLMFASLLFAFEHDGPAPEVGLHTFYHIKQLLHISNNFLSYQATS